jgi:hypothetical protein
MENRKAFISYSHDDETHKDWVRRLATDLRCKGIETYLDQWHLVPGDDLGVFMGQIAKVDYTLLVCTPNLAHKVNTRIGGIADEAEIIERAILGNPNSNSRFIPLVRRGVPSQSLPLCLSSKLHIDFRDDLRYNKSFESLLRVLLNNPMYIPPQLGNLQTVSSTININRSPDFKILVAGIGDATAISDDLVSVCQELGRKLAQNNYGLITGGWPGVDEIVARAFSAEIVKSNLALENYLTQVIVKTKTPTYTGGNLILIEEGDSEWTEPVIISDAIVLINGVGGTYDSGKCGMTFNKPVFPIADSGGDASKMYVEILMNWGAYPYKNIHKQQFQSLGGPVDYALDNLINLLANQFSYIESFE